jgi:RNA polymerase-binding transcription factor DksA
VISNGDPEDGGEHNGLSDVRGVSIPKARLDAMPEAIMTVQEEEQREKKVAGRRGHAQ